MVVRDLTPEAERTIRDEFNRTGDYAKMYRDYSELADLVWAATTRKDYQADLWYNLNRNEICLEMLGNLCEGKRVLSVGGGQIFEKELIEQITADEIIRTDIVAAEGIRFANVEDLPFPDSSFDVVLCRELIEHVQDEAQAFKEMHRVLKTDGLLLITTPNAYTGLIDGTIHVRGYSPITFIREVTEQGFEIVKKRGNVPYILIRLFQMVRMGLDFVLDEYKEIDKITRGYEDRYYLSTQLFILARKK